LNTVYIKHTLISALQGDFLPPQCHRAYFTCRNSLSCGFR